MKKRTNGNFIPNIPEPTAKDCVNVADQVYSAEIARLLGELVEEVKKIRAVITKHEPEYLSARLREQMIEHHNRANELIDNINKNTRG